VPELPERLPLSFTLDADHEAHEPPEAGRAAASGEGRGPTRDGVRLLVSRSTDQPHHTRFSRIADHLDPGDLLVVNTSGTVPAALDATIDDGPGIVVHLSTELPGGIWMVEPRQPIPGGATAPLTLAGPTTVRFTDGRSLALVAPAPGSERLWLALPEPGTDPLGVALELGRAIRYGYVERDWPIDRYQSIFSTDPGSAEMPSAARPFTPAVVDDLAGHGVELAAITLHTGVSSLEGHELPYPERYRVTGATADAVNRAHFEGRRVVAVGTTVVRALESAVDEDGRNIASGDHGVVIASEGWTDVVITPARGVRVVDGLLTGWHEPAATHLAMLEAVAGREALVLAYEAAFAAGYLWHEFGDSHLLLP
jgi:S-adenosylmethionine:tRNA ribosyltransferase-isomerase